MYMIIPGFLIVDDIIVTTIVTTVFQLWHRFYKKLASYS
jgi:hypothetical protein